MEKKLKPTIFNIASEALNRETEKVLTEFAHASRGQDYSQLEDGDRESLAQDLKWAEEVLYAQFTGETFDGQKYRGPSLSFSEALSSSDASILFPRVISEILLEPTEPNLWLTNNATEFLVVQNAPLVIEFPSLGALEAFEMSEGQEYRQQALSWQEHMTSFRLRKYGVLAAVPDEVIENSQWPIVRLYLKHMAAAINRKQESLLFKALMSFGREVFNNTSTDPTKWTTGKKQDQTLNYSFSYNDLIKLVGAVIAGRYEPTHFLAHPMAWPIFATDPLLRAQFFNGGQVGMSIWSTMPQFDQSLNFPFGIAYVPYYAMPFQENITLSGPASGLGASNVTDVVVIDSRNALFAATRGDIEMDDMEAWLRDARVMKARKYLGVSVKDRGNGIAHARNIRLVQNHEAIFTVRTVSS
jgi:hypothetical protein